MKRTTPLPLLALTTALALSLGGCMAKTTTTAMPVDALPSYQQSRQTTATQQAVQAENRLAALQPKTTAAVTGSGLVLLRRTEPVQRPPSPEELEATVTRLSNAVVAAREASILEAAARTSAAQSEAAALQLAQLTKQELSALEQRNQTYAAEIAAREAATAKQQATATTRETTGKLAGVTLTELKKLREETAHQLELLKQQSAYEAQLAELKATQTALQQARLEAERAEARSKEFTIAEVGAQKAASNAQLGHLLAESRAAEARTQGQIESTAAKLAALSITSAERLEAGQQITQAKMEKETARLAALAATSAERLEANQKVAAVQLAAEQQITRANLKQLEETTKASLTGESAKLAALTATAAERLEANQKVADAKTDALKETTATQLAAIKDQQSTQFRTMLLADKLRDDNTRQQIELSELRSTQRDAETRQQLEDLAQLTATNQKLMKAETQRMGTMLADYSNAQVRQLAADTNATITRVATAAQMDVADLRARTAEKLGDMQTAQKAEFQRLAKAANNSIISRVATAEKKAEDRRLKPAEVKEIATSTIRESATEFRALALQTLADSQDYIRATARTAVKDDPDTKAALQQAARDVITKDNQIVFAIRKVVDKRLATLPMSGYVAGTVPDGRPANTYNGEEIALDGTRLGVAPEAIEPGAGPATGKAPGQQIASVGANVRGSISTQPGMMRARQRHDWIDLRKYRVVLHEDGRTLPQMVGDVVTRAEPYTGPWEIKWKVSRENADLLTEKFSLDAETTFEEFVNYLANYMVNERGVKLSFSLFDSERVLVISD